MASIHDVAREAKVAPSTVSLVANGKGRVSSKTRQRVEEAIKRLSYAPTPRKQERHVAVVYTPNMLVDGKLVQFCREWIRGIRNSFEGQGVSVNIFAGREHVSQDVMFEQSLAENDFDGLIIMGAVPGSGYLDRAIESRLPMVAFNRIAERGEFSHVTVDAFGVGWTALSRLLSFGHRKIGIVIQAKYAHNQACLQGALEALKHAGIEPEYLWDGSQPVVTAEEVADIMLERHLTALYSGDPLARDVGDALISKGVSIPEQISIVGSDDMGFALSNGCRLTSVKYSKLLMGELAGKMLQEMLNSRGQVVNMTATVKVSIEPGATVGPVA